MRKRFFLSLIVILIVFTLTNCGNNESYSTGGISISSNNDARANNSVNVFIEQKVVGTWTCFDGFSYTFNADGTGSIWRARDNTSTLRFRFYNNNVIVHEVNRYYVELSWSGSWRTNRSTYICDYILSKDGLTLIFMYRNGHEGIWLTKKVEEIQETEEDS